MNSSSSKNKEYTEIELKNLLLEKPKNQNDNLSVREDIECIERINERKKVDSRSLTHNSREQWNSYIEYLLSIIGFVIDLGNVWR
jgi:hypothetical protein